MHFLRRFWKHPWTAAVCNIALLMLIYSLMRVFLYFFFPHLYRGTSAPHVVEMMLGGLRFANYLCAGGFNPVFLAMLSRISPPEKRGMLLGMAASFRILGMLLAPAAGGGLLLVFGNIRSVFFGAAAVFLILIPLIALAVKDMRKNNPTEETV